MRIESTSAPEIDDMSPSRPISRRRLTQLLAAASAGGLAAACGDSGSGPQEVEGRPTEGPQRVIRLIDLVDGEPHWFEYPEGHEAFAVKLAAPLPGGAGPNGDIVAYQNACPHMGCPLTEVDAEAGTLGPCACHFSLFDLRRNGAQVRGRATQNLVRVNLEVDADGILCATGINGLPYGEALREES